MGGVAVLIASDLSKDIAGEPLLRGVSFKLERRDRMTIAGRNGAGKTTLLRMLSGETGVDGGELVFEKGVRVALHDQRPPRERALSLSDYVLSGCKEPLELEAELGRLEAAMAAGDERAIERYAGVQARFEAAGGYTWREGVTSIVHGLGFTDADLQRPLSTFSGGELTRGSLARALASKPDLLLLDEPTNHLDIESLEWLEQTLVTLDAAVILVAHDRWFLEAVGTCVLELEAGRSRFFSGPWHKWRQEQAAREMALGKAISKQQAEIERMERFVERFRYKATKAKQAQSRLKKLDKIERITRDPKDGKGLGFQFKPVERSGRVVFELEDGRVEVPGRTLLHDAQLWLERGEHVSLVGPNGTGKTTLISSLGGARPLAGGRLRTGHNVKVGYLSQHGEELEWGGARTVLEAAIKRTGLSPNEARSLLGRFLFSGEEVDKPLDGLSGGERKRLGLAILVSGGANVLILDEPTNHLDLESREALEDALRAYEGSLLLVTHDRALLDAVGTRTVAVEEYTLHSYTGGWAEYARIREERKEAGIVPSSAPPPPPIGGSVATGLERRPDGMAARATDAPAAPAQPAQARQPAAAPQPKGPSKNRQKEQRRLEQAVEAAEAVLSALEDELADPAAWATKYESAKSTARHTAAKRAVEEAYEALAAFEERVRRPDRPQVLQATGQSHKPKTPANEQVSKMTSVMRLGSKDIGSRLGLNVPREVWPSTGSLAEYRAAGFGWVQLHTPPARVLGDRRRARHHARALHSLLDQAELRLVLHAPDSLSAGTPESDAAFDAMLDYAAEAGAERIAYHGLNFPDTDGADAAHVRERVSLEEGALHRLLQRAHTLGLIVAIENLAPVFPGPRRLCDDPIVVRDLVRRLGLPGVGMLLDLGHLHVTADASHVSLAALAAECAPDVVLFHVHDNLGARRREVDAPGMDPLKLDLHLAPGGGTLPWARVAAITAEHDAPLVLEVQPQHRPALHLLQTRSAALLAPSAQLRAAA